MILPYDAFSLQLCLRIIQFKVTNTEQHIRMQFTPQYGLSGTSPVTTSSAAMTDISVEL